jgi:cellobiose phosphorylase
MKHVAGKLAKSDHAYGDLVAKLSNGPLWKFTDKHDGSFIVPDPQSISRLYFPLCNEAGMKSFVTPDLKGDIALTFRNYLTIPVSTEDLHRTKSSRNFWVYVDGFEPWSITGVSAFASASLWSDKQDEALAEAGFGYFKLVRINRIIGLKATTVVFVPETGDTVEIMKVTIENISGKARMIVATAATPLFGRPAENLRDHRQVTTNMSRISLNKYGVIAKPTIYHEERGHSRNETFYAVLGWSGKYECPVHIWPTLREFVGEGGCLDNPEAVYKNLAAPKAGTINPNGVEAIGAFRFKPVKLVPGKSSSFVVVHGITKDKKQIDVWPRKFSTIAKVDASLAKTIKHWQSLASVVKFNTSDSDFNNWMKWISVQPIYRKFYGCSYLPDHDYGRGGRGWRDLWQDLISLFLIDPVSTRSTIVDNFRGVRIDGSNATVIGEKAGEFLADRNNIPRTWSDHGCWPFWVLKFYMDQTGDFDILFKNLSYWKDQFSHRCKGQDVLWKPQQGNAQKDVKGKVYYGTILEHMLVQQLSSFYHVGKHNNILLEGADWNDGYDMARKNGESVCFTTFYAYNLKEFATVLERLAQQGIKHIELLSEILLLLDRLPGGEKVNYVSPAAKLKRLKAFFDAIEHTVSGKKVKVSILDLAHDLKAKAHSLFEHIRKNEWLKTKKGCFFNGHYDDSGKRVDGTFGHEIRMGLTTQVMALMCEVATDRQISEIYKSVLGILKDPRTGGLRLCTEFKEPKFDFGRGTALTYGFKEHGSVFNHMFVMFIYSLYQRGFVCEGYDIFRILQRMCMDSATSKIYPGIPEFFDRQGRGAYCYLTGAATWLLLTMLTQIFGIRGFEGNVCIDPKLMKQQFDKAGTTQLECSLLGRRLRITFINKKFVDWPHYSIRRVLINKTEAQRIQSGSSLQTIVAQSEFLKLCNKVINEIQIILE